MGEIQFLPSQITPLYYINLYLSRGWRPWGSSKAAVPKHHFGDVFLSITAWEGRRKKSPVSVLLPFCWNCTSDVEIYQGLPRSGQVCPGLRLPFKQDCGRCTGRKESSSGE